MKNLMLIKNYNNQSKTILTHREVEYLALVALGFSNNEIAEKLVVTTSTVKKTLENIFRKLHASDRANAVAIAFVLGILNMQNLLNWEKGLVLIQK